MPKGKSFPIWLFTIAAMIGLTIPVLVQDGMFCDGELYTCVSRNMSIGYGTFWFPQYSTLNVGGLSSFLEHPPLVFGIQSLFFRLLGDHFYVERFYVVLMFLGATFLIIRIWNIHLKQNGQEPRLAWLPLILWISTPIVFWSYANNMQENTVNVFALIAVLFSLKAIRQGRMDVIMIFLSGLFVFFASFSKGIPGFFPIAVPLIYWLVYKKTRLITSVWQTAIMLSVPVLIYFVLFQIPESRESLTTYLFKRLLHRIDIEPTAEYRLESIVRTFTELIPAFILMAIAFIFSLIKKVKPALKIDIKGFYLYTLIGLSAIVPMTFTMVQKGFYLTPGFPYLAIALALVVFPIIDNWVDKIDVNTRSYSVFTSVTFLLLIGAVVYSGLNTGKIRANAPLIEDVQQIVKIVPPMSTITVPKKMYHDYDFVTHVYFMRQGRVSLSPYKQYDYYLKFKELEAPDSLLYEKIPLITKRFDLYRLRK